MNNKKAPWFPFYPSDWLTGCLGLSAAERGVYVTLIAAMYDANGPIMRDDSRLSRMCGLPKRSFSRALIALIKLGKVTESDRFLFNERAKNVCHDRQILRAHKVEGARLTNEKKQTKSNSTSTLTDTLFDRSPNASRARVFTVTSTSTSNEVECARTRAREKKHFTTSRGRSNGTEGFVRSVLEDIENDRRREESTTEIIPMLQHGGERH